MHNLVLHTLTLDFNSYKYSWKMGKRTQFEWTAYRNHSSAIIQLCTFILQQEAWLMYDCVCINLVNVGKIAISSTFDSL